MVDKSTRRLGQPERRLKFVSLKLERVSVNICRTQITLQRESGRKIICRCSGTASEIGVLHSAASATAAALGEASDAGPDAFQIIDIEKVKVFGKAAVAVAIAVRSKTSKINLVGFVLMDPKRPEQAGAMAVLNGTNRYISGFLSGRVPRRREKS